jgi:hypothetical protein
MDISNWMLDIVFLDLGKKGVWMTGRFLIVKAGKTAMKLNDSGKGC